MAYDEGLAQRIRDAFDERGSRSGEVREKKMFGGLAFLLDGHMCMGVVGDELMARVGPDDYEGALREPHARAMDFTGRPMKGFVYVGGEGFDSDAALAQWLKRCTSYASSLPPK